MYPFFRPSTTSNLGSTTERLNLEETHKKDIFKSFRNNN